MRYPTIDAFLGAQAAQLAKGPIAVLLAEDETAVAETIQHHLQLGFAQVLLFTPPELQLPAALEAQISRIDHDVFVENAMVNTVNELIDLAAGQWIYYCYNAEFLYYPFCETRSIRDLIGFHSEERRSAMLSYVIDLYAKDLTQHDNAVSMTQAHLDRSGYYALARSDAASNWEPRERQQDFFGGLRWRFEEHVPWAKRKIDRIALFRAAPGLRLRPDFCLTDEELNTYACPWHNNATAAVCSFRTAKALRANPGSRQEIHNFMWHNSVAFEWHSQQLMDLGLMEPGQWF